MGGVSLLKPRDAGVSGGISASVSNSWCVQTVLGDYGLRTDQRTRSSYQTNQRTRNHRTHGNHVLTVPFKERHSLRVWGVSDKYRVSTESAANFRNDTRTACYLRVVILLWFLECGFSCHCKIQRQHVSDHWQRSQQLTLNFNSTFLWTGNSNLASVLTWPPDPLVVGRLPFGELFPPLPPFLSLGAGRESHLALTAKYTRGSAYALATSSGDWPANQRHQSAIDISIPDPGASNFLLSHLSCSLSGVLHPFRSWRSLCQDWMTL